MLPCRWCCPPQSYARLYPSDAEVFFHLRTGQLYFVQHTDEHTHPLPEGERAGLV